MCYLTLALLQTAVIERKTSPETCCGYLPKFQNVFAKPFKSMEMSVIDVWQSQVMKGTRQDGTTTSGKIPLDFRRVSWEPQRINLHTERNLFCDDLSEILLRSYFCIIRVRVSFEDF